MGKQLELFKEEELPVWVNEVPFVSEVEKFKKKIVKISYYGLPQFFRLGLNKKDRIVWKLSHKFKSAQEMNFLRMIIPVEKKIFIREAKIFLDNYFKKKNTNKYKNLKHIVLDQGANFWNPKLSSLFLKNSKIILVTRDPRSIYSSMKVRKSLSFPGHNLEIFISWYKEIMKEFKKVKQSKKVIIINYEKFILNHQKEKKKLLKFMGIKESKKIYDGLNRSRKNIFKARSNLSDRELKKISKSLNEYLKWPKNAKYF